MSPLRNGDAQALIIHFSKEFSSYLATIVYLFQLSFDCFEPMIIMFGLTWDCGSVVDSPGTP
jgi:hypothetical protein